MAEAKKYLPSFGRKHGRALKIGKNTLLETLLPTLLIDAQELSGLKTPVHLEIGYGNGEHLCGRAQENPEITFIGCEVYEHGIAACLKHIQEHKLTNIRLYRDDARILLDALPSACLNKLYLLFPDPWPKKKHHKRRILNQEMLALLHRVMAKNAELSLATDHHLYARWMLVHLLHHDGFESLARSKSDWLTPPKGHTRTRYQEKNKANTHYPIFLNFKKI